MKVKWNRISRLAESYANKATGQDQNWQYVFLMLRNAEYNASFLSKSVNVVSHAGPIGQNLE